MSELKEMDPKALAIVPDTADVLGFAPYNRIVGQLLAHIEWQSAEIRRLRPHITVTARDVLHVRTGQTEGWLSANGWVRIDDGFGDTASVWRREWEKGPPSIVAVDTVLRPQELADVVNRLAKLHARVGLDIVEEMAARCLVAEWQPIDTAPEGVVVETRLSDASGERNVQPLKRQGRLWFFADGSMYVYYTPTHWRPLEASRG